MPYKPQKPGKGNPKGARSGHSVGMGLFGGVKGGPTPGGNSSQTTQTQDDSGDDTSGGGDIDPSMTDSSGVGQANSQGIGGGFTPYKASNPVLDYLFNHGQGHMMAAQANIAYQTAQALQSNSQQFELKRQAIENDNTLNRDQKLAMINQAAQDHKAANDIATENARVTAQNVGSSGSVVDPDTIAQFKAATTPGNMLAAGRQSQTKATQAGTGLVNSEAQFQGTSDAASDLPALTSNPIRQQALASQGALANQPAVNAAQAFATKLQPAMARTALNREGTGLAPTGAYNYNTQQWNALTPGAQGQQVKNALQNYLLSGMMNGNTSGPAGMNMMSTGAPSLPVGIPQGSVPYPDGTFLTPDGRKLDKNGNPLGSQGSSVDQPLVQPQGF